MTSGTAGLREKISLLVRERGWNQEEFARLARLNRHTVRRILQDPLLKLRNGTVESCARALGYSVHELTTAPVDALLCQVRTEATEEAGRRLSSLRENASHPELKAWIERHPERAAALPPTEIRELLAFQKAGNFTAPALEGFINRLERRFRLMEKIQVLARTRHFDLLEQLVDLMFQHSQGVRDKP
ncbi:MAG: hypothetical protein EXR99_12475 [Gemmataceae bacterium]|nr:hypothetical protein [Gemmataceae bacterium]